MAAAPPVHCGGNAGGTATLWPSCQKADPGVFPPPRTAPNCGAGAPGHVRATGREPLMRAQPAARARVAVAGRIYGRAATDSSATSIRCESNTPNRGAWRRKRFARAVVVPRRRSHHGGGNDAARPAQSLQQQQRFLLLCPAFRRSSASAPCTPLL